MAEGGDGLHYDVMVENALRGVVREALTYAAEHGLPGEHHFYITFRTTHSGVEMPDSLRARYPQEMTIVLQFQYWDLEVGEDGFAVTLSFNDDPSRLVVPYAAVSAFADPSVRFGLQFDAGESDGEDEAGGDGETGQAGAPAPVSVESDAGGAETGDSEGNNVITLDRFRKQ